MKNSYDSKLFNEIELHKDDIYVLHHELDTVVPQHKHTQGHILLVLDGVANVNIERYNHFIPIGYFVWIPPRVSHRIWFEGKKIKLLNIYYPTSMAVDGFYQKVGVYPIPSIVYHIFELVSDETVTYSPENWKYEILVTLNHILPHIVQENKIRLRLPISEHPVVVKIVNEIHRRYQRTLTADMIGEAVGISVRSLSRYMRSELNVTFIEYLRTYRIMMAINKIVRGGDTITNIAYDVGYESLTAFSNSFYKVTGSRPSQFLK